MKEQKFYVLGLLSSAFLNEEAKQVNYNRVFKVPQEVLDFLSGHDTYFTEFGEKVFPVNRVHYVFLGEFNPQQEVKEIEKEVVDEVE